MVNGFIRMTGIVMIFLLISSCASTNKIPAGGNATPEKLPALDKALSGIKSVSILGDFCIAEHLGALLMNDSVAADRDTLEGIANMLGSMGTKTVICPFPYVGSYLRNDKPAEVKIGDKIENRTPPFAQPAIKDTDPSYNDALLKMILAVASLDETGLDNMVKSFQPDDKTAECMSAIAKKTGTDAILVFVSQGLIYPQWDKSLTPGSGTGINFKGDATSPIQIVDLRKDGIDGITVLIELKSRSILWYNSYSLNMPVHGNVDAEFYKKKLPDAILNSEKTE